MRPATVSASRPRSASAPRSIPAPRIRGARSSASTARSKRGRGGSKRSPCTISKSSTASWPASAVRRSPCSSACCRSTASGTRSSSTTKCPVSRFPMVSGPGFATPATVRSASASRWRSGSWPRSMRGMPARISCRPSAASKSSRRCSMSSDDARLLTRLNAREAQRRIRDGKITAEALLEACLDRIRTLDGELKAWTHVDQAGARAMARQYDADTRAGRLRGPLHGVPIGIKDIFDVAGLPTTGGARPWAHRRATEDATSVARLRAAGAVIVGKTATTEFAYRDPAPTRNPWNLGHTPGGSSAGSGAAVAARMIPLANGSQTVGSVLRPAAYNGVVGFKPTHGLIPVEGVIPLAWSFDHVGVLARSVDDAALMFGVLAGGEYDAAVGRPPRIAVATELIARAEPDLTGHLRAAADAFRK